MMEEVEQYEKERELEENLKSTNAEPDYKDRLFDEYLLSAEHIIWEGKGSVAVLNSTPIKVIKLIFPIIWIGFSIIWTLLAALGSILFALFGVPFIVVGVVLLKNCLKNENSPFYGLTNFRALIFKDTVLTEKKLEDIEDIQVQTFPKYNTGSIIYDKKQNSNNDFITEIGFINISDTQNVYKLFSQAVADRKEEFSRKD